MATETHKTTTDKYGNKLTHVTKSNNPSRQGTYFFTSAPQPNVHSTMPSVVKTRQASPKAKLTAPKSKLAGKITKATPPGRAIKVGSSIKSHLPHSDKRTTPALVKATNHSPILAAEYGIVVLIITGKGISDIARIGYQTAISGIMLRFTAATALWFVLFLLASSKKGSAFAAWFGFLVVLGAVFDAVNSQSTTDLTSIIQGQPLTNSDGTLLVVDEKPSEFYETAGQVKPVTDTSGQAE
jgi:hypothetical protein